MRVTDDLLKSVCFIAIRNHEDGFMHMKGTAFFVTCDYRKPTFQYVVTAKHVIEEIDKIGIDDIYLMVNLKDGTRGAVRTNTKDWMHSDDKTVDISIHHGILTDEFDHLKFHYQKF